MSEHNPSKRRFIKTVSYVTPVILTLSVAPSLASSGSAKGKWKDDEGQGGNDGPGGNDGQGGNTNGPGANSAQSGRLKKKKNWWWPFS